ncbi:hypothetical protein BUALT_Bualt18G0012400 [Buddleja alternifolia]|uniref:RNase III domain-containing protein n=1 Tax=Buddleja alternifolia TaxID=168488 RepID=A0AAV6WBZ1_9LAMI|nr:hypothetical protein BUALT_Bualt18G0012400 [Buddleja alternifolia]
MEEVEEEKEELFLFLQDKLLLEDHKEQEHDENSRAEAIKEITSYEFHDPILLQQALTHHSYEEGCSSYERLAYFGDAFLNFSIAKEHYFLYPDLNPGKLPRLRAANADTEKLARVEAPIAQVVTIWVLLSRFAMSNKKINSYFKKRGLEDKASPIVLESSTSNLDNIDHGIPNSHEDQASLPKSSPTKVRKVDRDSNTLHIERDPGLRKSIWDYPFDKRDEIRRAYLIQGPFQGIPKSPPNMWISMEENFYPLGTSYFPIG